MRELSEKNLKKQGNQQDNFTASNAKMSNSVHDNKKNFLQRKWAMRKTTVDEITRLLSLGLRQGLSSRAKGKVKTKTQDLHFKIPCGQPSHHIYTGCIVQSTHT